MDKVNKDELTDEQLATLNELKDATQINPEAEARLHSLLEELIGQTPVTQGQAVRPEIAATAALATEQAARELAESATQQFAALQLQLEAKMQDQISKAVRNTPANRVDPSELNTLPRVVPRPPGAKPDSKAEYPAITWKAEHSPGQFFMNACTTFAASRATEHAKTARTIAALNAHDGYWVFEEEPNGGWTWLAFRDALVTHYTSPDYVAAKKDHLKAFRAPMDRSGKKDYLTQLDDFAREARAAGLGNLANAELLTNYFEAWHNMSKELRPFQNGPKVNYENGLSQARHCINNPHYQPFERPGGRGRPFRGRGQGQSSSRGGLMNGSRNSTRTTTANSVVAHDSE